MAIKRFNVQWTAVWWESGSYRYEGNPIRVGGSNGYNTALGMNSTAILDAIQTSKTRARTYLNYYVTDSGEFNLALHKLTSNPKTSLPYYDYAGITDFPGPGWHRRDITDLKHLDTAGDSFRSALENGYHGVMLFGPGGAAEGSAYGLGGSAPADKEPYIEVEGSWNAAPSAAALTYPVGGETLSGLVALKTDPATDPEGDALSYQFYLYDGETHYFNTTTTSKTVDLSKYKETSNAQAGVRAYDGQSYGPWTHSKVFTIRHNIPPSQPTLLEPLGGASRDRTRTIRFLWNHNDQDPQSLFRYRWRVQGTTTWTETETVTTDELIAIPGNTFPAGNIEWQVQTEDQGGLISPWSPTGLFLSTEKSNAPTILSPANGEVIPSEELTIRWSSSGQVEYEVVVLAGANVHWSALHASGNKGVSVGAALVNYASYTVQVRVKDAGGIWSDWAEVSITTSFTPPTQPELSVSTDERLIGIYVEINNPLPAGTQPDVSYNDLYRKAPDGEWVRIGKNLLPDTGFMDYTPAGNIVYEYYAKAVADNHTTMNSVAVIGSVPIKGVHLALANNPNIYATLKMSASRNFHPVLDEAKLQFNGRKRPVSVFGEMEENDFVLDYLVDEETYRQLSYMFYQRTTLLYRDERGRRYFATMAKLPTDDDRMPGFYRVQLPLSEVDVQEGV